MHITGSCSRSVTAVHMYCWYILKCSIPEVWRPADVAEMYAVFWRLKPIRRVMLCPHWLLKEFLPAPFCSEGFYGRTQKLSYKMYAYTFAKVCDILLWIHVPRSQCLVPSVWQAAWLRSWCFLGMLLQQNLTERYFWSLSCLCWVKGRQDARYLLEGFRYVWVYWGCRNRHSFVIIFAVENAYGYLNCEIWFSCCQGYASFIFHTLLCCVSHFNYVSGQQSCTCFSCTRRQVCCICIWFLAETHWPQVSFLIYPCNTKIFDFCCLYLF